MTYTPLSLYRKNLAALAMKTRLLLGDPAGERWSDARVIEAINFAVLEFAIETECIKDEVEIRLLVNFWSYDIKEAVEQNAALNPFGWPLRIGYNGTASPALKPISSHVVDRAGIDRSGTGTVNRFHMDMLSYGEIGVLPLPSSDGAVLPSDVGNLQVTYVGMPDQMTLNTDFPDNSIQAMYHQYIPYMAACLLLEEGDEEDLAMAIAYESNFKSGCYENVGDQYAGQTGYADMRPM